MLPTREKRLHMSFEDHFSGHARLYARYRPIYPPALFEYLASLAPSRQLAWDCGTGNGQTAVALAPHFRQVVATDASAEQIASASPHERVEYRQEDAGHTSLGTDTVDLITASVAVHWFDLDAFYAEVRRVGREGAILAVWTYHLPIITPAIDRSLEDFYRYTLAGYWPERIRYLEERYRTLPFPFPEIEPPEFVIEAEWTIDDLIGFVASWSGTRKYLEAEGENIFAALERELEQQWGEGDRKRPVRWPLHFRIGRVEG